MNSNLLGEPCIHGKAGSAAAETQTFELWAKPFETETGLSTTMGHGESENEYHAPFHVSRLDNTNKHSCCSGLSGAVMAMALACRRIRMHPRNG